MFEVARASKLALRVALLATAAGFLSACSSMPEWTDPSSWVGSGSDDTATSATDTSDSSQTGSEGKTVAEASDKYPALADTPDKAPPTTSTDEQKEVSNGLVADRSQAQYSAEVLRGGSETAASPPPPPGAEPAMPPPASDSTATASATPPAAPAPSQTAAAAPQTSSMPGTLPSEGTSPPPQQQIASATAPVTAASAPPPPPPPVAAPVAPAPQMNPSDAALGFQPSHAPPLDPGVAQLVSSGGRTTGRQVAALAPAVMPAAPMMTASGPAAAAVTFAQDATVLTDAARAQVRTAVEAFKAQGGQGFVRVVGHSSAGGKLAPERKMVVDLERSTARANAVARELIKQGIPASKVLVEAVGDTRSGADSERRADIFVQS